MANKRLKSVQRVMDEDYFQIVNRLSLTSQELLNHSPIASAIIKNYSDELHDGNTVSEEVSVPQNHDFIDDQVDSPVPVIEVSTNSINDAGPSSGTSQETNLDANGAIPFSFGMRSTGKGSPIRGRSVKECEEQLDHLKKENFKLKLRIYFLEDRMRQKGISMDKEELAKANMELKVEMESLKKELYDKQVLVRQASNLLSTLETQYAEEIQRVKFISDQEQEELRERVNFLEKEVSAYSEKVAYAENAAVSNLTQLCDLAFDSAVADEVPSLTMDPTNPQQSGVMQGIFSLPTPEMASINCIRSRASLNGSKCGRLSNGFVPKSESQKNRIEELEAKVNELETHVEDLEEELYDRRRTADALEEDINNLKRQLEDREEKLIDLEAEVNEKDLKVDQLMVELETRHREIKAKDSSIETLHQELEKVEPAIEVKVQQVVERDRIIEEKIEQLQHQNKILVEIQITLDEKQKQIAELEFNLQEALNRVEKVNQEFEISCETIKGMASEICSRDKEISHLERELKRKEKRNKDLIAELKEATDMLKKAKWEAETSGGEDGVKEMVEEENERAAMVDDLNLKVDPHEVRRSGAIRLGEKMVRSEAECEELVQMCIMHGSVDCAKCDKN